MVNKEKIKPVEVESVRDVEEIDEDSPPEVRLEAALDEAVDYIREELMTELKLNTEAVLGNTQALGLLVERLQALGNLGNIARIFKRT